MINGWKIVFEEGSDGPLSKSKDLNSKQKSLEKRSDSGLALLWTAYLRRCV